MNKRLNKVNNYIVAACDLDGTLLEGSNLSKENAEAVRLLKAQGINIVLATGRNFHQAIDFHKALKLTSPMVTSDGALVTLPGVNGVILHEQVLMQDLSAQILLQAEKDAVTCLSYFRHGVYVSSRTDWNESMERHRDMGRHFRYSSVKSMSRKPIYKILLFANQAEKLDSIQERFSKSHGAVTDTIRNSPNTLEFVSKGVSKVSGLNVVSQHMGFTAKQALAFGDGVNDIGMFHWAGLSVCMHHGHTKAKAAAKIVAEKSPAGTNFAIAVENLLKVPSEIKVA